MSERQPSEAEGRQGSPAADRMPPESARQPNPEPPAKNPNDGTTGNERLKEAVEAARLAAEQHATAEIMALEEDLERERERAAKSLEEVQRRLHEAEARAAETANVDDVRARSDATGRLRDQPEQELQRERDAARRAAEAAQARFD